MSNHRKRKTERGVNDFDALLSAMKSIKLNNVSIRKAAAANDIPERSLNRYKMKFDEQVENIKDHNDEELLQILRGIASYKNCAVHMVGIEHECCFVS